VRARLREDFGEASTGVVRAGRPYLRWRRLWSLRKRRIRWDKVRSCTAERDTRPGAWRTVLIGDPMTRMLRKGVLEAEGFPVADVSERLEQADTVVWVDFCGPSKEQLHELAGELGLHELAVEDALGPHQPRCSSRSRAS